MVPDRALGAAGRAGQKQRAALAAAAGLFRDERLGPARPRIARKELGLRSRAAGGESNRARVLEEEVAHYLTFLLAPQLGIDLSTRIDGGRRAGCPEARGGIVAGAILTASSIAKSTSGWCSRLSRMSHTHEVPGSIPGSDNYPSSQAPTERDREAVAGRSGAKTSFAAPSRAFVLPRPLRPKAHAARPPPFAGMAVRSARALAVSPPRPSAGRPAGRGDGKLTGGSSLRTPASPNSQRERPRRNVNRARNISLWRGAGGGS